MSATKAAKVVLEQELIECERQIMLLERKLELEKETQAACVQCSATARAWIKVTLLCRYNQEDETGNIIKSMKREIHKMVTNTSFPAHFSGEVTCARTGAAARRLVAGAGGSCCGG